MVIMVDAQGRGESSTSNSNPNTNDAAYPVQTETIAPGPIKMNVEEIVVVSEIEDKEENAIDEVKNKGNAIVVVRNEGNAIEDEKNEENAMEVEKKNEEYAFEEDENNEENAIVEEENAIEEEENATEEESEENATEEENEIEEEEIATEEEKAEADSKEKMKKSRKRSRKKKAARKGSEAVAAKDKDKPESSSKKKKSSKKAESMGMIFMCSSKTKKDCYHYKVLGLPASKRDIVQKVYKGMRLFLFDFDLRLMYGIYKAARPGGYNIEPKAFKSAFPSQVRFTVLDDCLPLAEEKFRNVIKDNYYTRSKFDCQLTSEQVKNLCKLFLAANKGLKSKKSGRSQRTETRTHRDRDRIRQRAWDEDRHSALDRGRRYHERPVMYEREAFASPVALLPRVPPLPPPAPAPSYGYERTLDMDAYRRDPPFEHHDRRVLDLERRRREEIERRDPYVSYREPPLYRDPLYSAGLPPDYDHLAIQASAYRHLAGLPSEYRSAAVQPPEYNTLRPLYRY
uniref:DCD domain-containing protein n=1 Tax=Davidia involucrata TaxID=16924 RepID=A0A5B6YGV6_DAVIN